MNSALAKPTRTLVALTVLALSSSFAAGCDALINVEGHVRGRDGKPIASASVAFACNEWLRGDLTKADGSFRTGNVGCLHAPCIVTVTPRGGQPTTVDAFAAGKCSWHPSLCRREDCNRLELDVTVDVPDAAPKPPSPTP